MTISTIISSVTYECDGLQTVWPFEFNIPDDESYEVLITDADGAITTADPSTHSIVGLNDEQGGDVTYPLVGSPPPNGYKLTINRIVAYTQETKLRQQRRYDPQVVEETFDRLEMQIQQVNAKADRAVQVPISSDATPDDYLSDLTVLKNQAEAARDAALIAETNAETAETNAEAAQVLSEAAQTAAEVAQAAAEGARDSALAAQSAAETAQGLAETAQSAAETAETNAETAQGLAETAQSAAETAQSAAETAQGIAESAASTATTQAGIATSEAGDAASSASAAAASETNAAASEDRAYEWANNPEDDPVTTGPDQYSAYHWAQKAQDFASGAAVNISVDDSAFDIAAGANAQAALSDIDRILFSGLRGHLFGLTASNNGSDADHDIDFAAGSVVSEDGTAIGASTSAMTKRADATWMAGTGNGGMANSVSLPTSGTVHFFALINPATGALDFGFDTNVAATNLLATSAVSSAGFTKARRILSMLTDSSANFIGFVQDGDYIRRKASATTGAITNPGTTTVNRTIAAPSGKNFLAFGNARIINTSTTDSLLISDIAANDEAPTTSGAPLATMGTGSTSQIAFQTWQTRTNTSAQVRTKCRDGGANCTIEIVTQGWFDTRGRI